MKRIFTVAVVLLVHILSYAQTDSERYEQRYDLLVSKLGPAGIGVETVLNNWEKVDSLNPRLLLGKFSYLFTKAQTAEIVTRSSKKYLGMDPILSLKDSLGNDVYYFQENIFDDELYGQSIKAADKAIAAWPDRLDFRFMKANAYIAYEKESPDMALAYLLALADAAVKGGPWTFEGKPVEKGFFADAMQEYCYTFYSVGSPDAMEAFRALSEKMSALYPENVVFLNNVGSYHMVSARNYKAALKCYGKVLKKQPDDYTAIKNSMIAARKLQNVKLEKKYLALLVKHGPADESRQAEMRLKAMEK